MTQTFKLYALARKRLEELLEKLSGQELFYIGGPEPLPSPLTHEEELALVARLAQDDGTIRATLIERNLRLVVFIARKFENTGVALEDLISIGTIGLIKAVNTFDPAKKIKLATYASRCIENEVLMFLRRNSRTKVEVSLDEPLKQTGTATSCCSATCWAPIRTWCIAPWRKTPNGRCFLRR